MAPSIYSQVMRFSNDLEEDDIKALLEEDDRLEDECKEKDEEEVSWRK